MPTLREFKKRTRIEGFKYGWRGRGREKYMPIKQKFTFHDRMKEEEKRQKRRGGKIIRRKGRYYSVPK